MPLCLDTSTVVEALRSKPNLNVRRYLEAALARAEPLWIGSVVVHELMTGALKSERASDDLERVDAILQRLSIAELNVDDAISAARVRSDLKKRGSKIGSLDTLIAGQALARDWTLVTSDLKHFTRVKGLALMDWTRSDQPLDQTDILAQTLRPSIKEDR